MILIAFSIFDVKGSNFTPPFFMAAQGIALRNFSDLVNDPQTSVFKHPEDYKLYKVGSFDDNSGLFVPIPVPEFLCNATDFITKKSEETKNVLKSKSN